MDRDDGGTAVRMAQVEVAAFLANALKPKTLKEMDDFGGFENGKFTHAGTVTC